MLTINKIVDFFSVCYFPQCVWLPWLHCMLACVGAHVWGLPTCGGLRLMLTTIQNLSYTVVNQTQSLHGSLLLVHPSMSLSPPPEAAVTPHPPDIFCIFLQKYANSGLHTCRVCNLALTSEFTNNCTHRGQKSYLIFTHQGTYFSQTYKCLIIHISISLLAIKYTLLLPLHSQ